MKLSLLKDFFCNHISAKQLSENIKSEISEFEKALKIKGGSAPIYIIEDVQLPVGKKDILVLCQSYIDDTLTEIEVNYIVDALSLSENVSFESEDLFDVVVTMTDPEVNGPLTKKVVSDILEYCKA
jgi:hypothetical protein